MKNTALYSIHRYPPQVISTAVWLYHRFSLSFRGIEELMAQRAVIVSYESIRRWCLKFGPKFLKSLKRREGKGASQWHVDEVYLKINGTFVYLFRAVDQGW